jgi:hypothetical protein
LVWLGSLLVWAVFRVRTRGPERAGLAAVFLGIAGVLCLGLGLGQLTSLMTLQFLYVGLPFVIVGVAALWFALLGLTRGCPEEAHDVS